MLLHGQGLWSSVQPSRGVKSNQMKHCLRLRQLLLVAVCTSSQVPQRTLLGHSKGQSQAPRSALVGASLLGSKRLATERKRISRGRAPSTNRTKPDEHTRIERLFNKVTQAPLTRFLVSCSICWMAFASYQIHRDMQVFTKPAKGFEVRAKQANRRLRKVTVKARQEGVPVAITVGRQAAQQAKTSGLSAANTAMRLSAAARQVATEKAPEAKAAAAKAASVPPRHSFGVTHMYGCEGGQRARFPFWLQQLQPSTKTSHIVPSPQRSSLVSARVQTASDSRATYVHVMLLSD